MRGTPSWANGGKIIFSYNNRNRLPEPGAKASVIFRSSGFRTTVVVMGGVLGRNNADVKSAPEFSSPGGVQEKSNVQAGVQLAWRSAEEVKCPSEAGVQLRSEGVQKRVKSKASTEKIGRPS